MRNMLYQVVDVDDGFENVYCTTTDFLLAYEVYNTLVSGSTCKFINYEIRKNILDTHAPLISWLFFVYEDTITVATEDRDGIIETALGYDACYKIKAHTRDEAVILLKERFNVDFYDYIIA